MAMTTNTFAACGAGANVNAGQFWIYRTNDTIAQVTVAGYFDEVRSVLTKGDVILVQADVDGTVKAGLYMVTAINASAPYVTFAAATTV